jgi:2-polyprenyl-3-methyl-5-hydroxy-6-metoxy-1,4-benzoquinol methylase
MADNTDELREYWQRAYNDQSTRVAAHDVEGNPWTELGMRKSRNQWMLRDFLQHVKMRPKPIMTELLSKAESAIEVGCGTGEFLASLLRTSNIRLGLGTDISESAIKQAMTLNATVPEGKDLTWHVGDFLEIALTSQRAHLLIANQVVEHFRDPAAVVKKLQELAEYILIITPYKELVSEPSPDIIDGSDNHVVSIDESTYKNFNVVEDMVFFSKEGWGISRKGECPLQYAVLIESPKGEE